MPRVASITLSKQAVVGDRANTAAIASERESCEIIKNVRLNESNRIISFLSIQTKYTF